MNICLIGYRATGKSTVGAELARRIGFSFVDTDQRIEHREQKTISEMFAEQGEPYFRDVEEAVVADELRNQNQVLSLGGGAVMREATRERLKNADIVIWLQADTAEIMRRLSQDPNTQQQRPGLTDLPAEAEVTHLLAVRTPIYEQCATITIATAGRTPGDIVDEIVSRMESPSSEGVSE